MPGTDSNSWMQQLNKYVNHPAVKLPLYGGAAYLVGKYGSKAIGKMLMELSMSHKPPEFQEKMRKEYGKNQNLFTKVVPYVGLLGGATVAVAPHMDTKHGMGNFFRSISDSSYWDKNPSWTKGRTKGALNKIRDWFWKKSNFIDEFDLPYTRDNIPISYSLDLIKSDDYLDVYKKNELTTIITGAENSDSGITSGQKLTQSAIRMGKAAVPAYLFGRSVGTMLGLPKPISTRLGKIGGIAAATIKSGIFG